MQSLEDRVKQQARALGFELVGVAAATEADHFAQFLDWLDCDYAGDMDYLKRRAEAYRHPSAVLAEVRSIIMVGMNYKPADESEQNSTPVPSTGRVARYACGRDYHDVLRERLKQLLAWLRVEVPECVGRAVVDTAPLLERDFARRAGLGWFGKNTMLLNKAIGSYFFIGALLISIPLQPDSPHEASHCGTCTACLDACPTDAFVAPGQMDARRCISYLTIELRGPVPIDLRPLVGDWLFGCDVCQEVCPWNRKPLAGSEPALQPLSDTRDIDALELLTLSEQEFRERFRGTALLRARRSGLLRNAAIVLGNRGDPAALPALEAATSDADPVVAEAARWACQTIRERTELAFEKHGRNAKAESKESEVT